MSSESANEKRPLLLKQRHPKRSKHVLVIHGGAGTILRERSSPEDLARFHDGLRAALGVGNAILSSGGEAMDAVVAAVSVMEDNPIFNAGKGAVFNSAGFNELEASLALSRPPASHPDVPPSRHALALTLLTHTRNPSQLARTLYLSPDKTRHAFLSGAPAEDLGGLPPVHPSYFYTSARWREHRRGLGLPEDDAPPGKEEGAIAGGKDDDDDDDDDDEVLLDMMPLGTVGAVALDGRGCIAVCTSTGGRTNKLPGRVGDTPHNGAGFWAEEWQAPRGRWLRWLPHPWPGKVHAVGVSGTGDGDAFIRQNTAATLAHRMQYLNEPVQKAARSVVEALLREGGVGGVIALDNHGNVATPLNCPGMYRGLVREDGVLKTAIFEDEVLE
ncbi:asparaginase [Russula earlei]|uniref:Asparaginase n=1 Tax=Russula earlei TaxID=71964 RepID=A0ACC0TV64_9AGAM|nr:asparaginase [Russula earlei]